VQNILQVKHRPLYSNSLITWSCPVSRSASQNTGSRSSSRLTRMSSSVSTRLEGSLIIWIQNMIKKFSKWHVSSSQMGQCQYFKWEWVFQYITRFWEVRHLSRVLLKYHN